MNKKKLIQNFSNYLKKNSSKRITLKLINNLDEYSSILCSKNYYSIPVVDVQFWSDLNPG